MRRGGFTLVELVVASTLMTIVLAGVYTTFSTAIRTWRSGEVNYQTYEDARRVFGVLSRELRGVPKDALHLTNGGEDWIEFVTLAEPMDVEQGRGARLLLVRYSLDRPRDGGAAMLVREEALVEGPLPLASTVEDRSPPEVETGRAVEFVLAEDVEAFSIYYQWAVREVRRRQDPPAPALIVGDALVERATPQGLVVTLTLHDPGVVDGLQEAEFTSVVSFRGQASLVPRYLMPDAGA